MKILYVTTVGSTMFFFSSLIQKLIAEGHTVDIATNQENRPIPPIYQNIPCTIYHLPCSRSPFSKNNLKSIQQLRKIVTKNSYDIVHCHTPIAGAITRLACKNCRKKGLEVIYTAHGFHFYKGAPLKNWLIYYPIEKICSHFTDVLITINHEDYHLAKKKLKVKQVEYVPGVGLDVNKFANANINRNEKRKELGIPQDVFTLISVGELNENKNHQIVIRALAELKNPNIHYMIAGRGKLKDYLIHLAKELKIENQVHLVGFRTDVAELYKAADAVVFPSIREGLGLAAVEGMAAGLPLICADNRGTREYAKNEDNAIVCSNSIIDYASAINLLYLNEEKRLYLKKNAIITAQLFDVSVVNELMIKIYQTKA